VQRTDKPQVLWSRLHLSTIEICHRKWLKYYFRGLRSRRTERPAPLLEKHYTAGISSIQVIGVTSSDEDMGAVPADLSVFPPWTMTYEGYGRLQVNCRAVAKLHVVHFSLESFMLAWDRFLVAVGACCETNRPVLILPAARSCWKLPACTLSSLFRKS
jgi:hypothetical protein